MEDDEYSKITLEEVFKKLSSKPDGLSLKLAETRLESHGKNLLPQSSNIKIITLILRQLKSPLILLLIFAAILSALLGEIVDAMIILTILIISNGLQFWQEYQANDAVQKLLEIIQIKVNVLREGRIVDLPLSEIVPGDIAVLSAGDLVPGDCILFQTNDLFIDESALTGETFPAEKNGADREKRISKSTRGFLGTHVISGEGRGVIISTGKGTAFGKIAQTLDKNSRPSSFEVGIYRFSIMLMQITFIFLAVVFFVNIFYKRPPVDSFLFALAIAVGMTPQLLPATLSMTLALGAKSLARKKVIVKRLNAIENLGSMTVLCSDKTGTLTEGVMTLDSFVGVTGKEKKKVLEYAILNAKFQTGFMNPIDQTILQHSYIVNKKYEKIDEIPYDFKRKRLTVSISDQNGALLISKGAFEKVLQICNQAEDEEGKINNLDSESLSKIRENFRDLSTRGLRVLAVAYRNLPERGLITKNDEHDFIFLGLICFHDPLKENVIESLNKLRELGIKVKIISGDNRFIVEKLNKEIGLQNSEVLTGEEISELSESALTQRFLKIDAFAEVDPAQKERIIHALQKGGETVGFLGDGINDAPALYKADVGISVERAVDIAKSAASIVILEKNLDILSEGIREGRRIFSNSLKYIFITTSANFGNMFSMATASLFLPFLPLLPKQILFNNLLTSFPSLSIGTDFVDKELIEKPRKWDIQFIRRFMLFFGLHSSLFDLLTFYILHWHLNLSVEAFRTGWFIESSVTQVLILLVIRTPKPFFKSRPSKYLLSISLIVVLVSIVFPLFMGKQLFDFVLLDLTTILYLLGIIVLYITTAELVKKWFYKRWFF